MKRVVKHEVTCAKTSKIFMVLSVFAISLSFVAS